MHKAYKKSGLRVAASYSSWTRFSKHAYVSSTHGGRYVQNFANKKARAYGRYEKSGKMPKGAVVAKNSFSASPAGKVGVGPLFLMEKMGKGFNKASGDWAYSMVMPNGSIFGVTNGKGSAKVKFCIGCHATVAEAQDHMFFLPANVRVK